jgi:hypothetical protein
VLRETIAISRGPWLGVQRHAAAGERGSRRWLDTRDRSTGQ